MLCGPAPTHKNMVLVSCKSFSDIQKVLHTAKAELSDILRAVEFLDWNAVSLVLANNKQVTYPFDDHHEFFCLIEV